MRASQVLSADFLNDLSSGYARRRFFWAFFIVTAACILLDFLLSLGQESGYLIGVARSILIEVASGTLIVLVVYFVAIYFIGVNPESDSVISIRPGDIGDGVRKLPVETAFYMFWGRSGTYFRAVTLRNLDEEARTKRKTIEITVILPNPSSPELMRAYSDMQKELGESEDSEKLLKNVLATASACSIALQNNRNLKINLYLSNFLPAFRIDLSEQGAFLTQDDPSLYGLRFGRRSQFYEMFRSMIYNESKLSEDVNLKAYDCTGLTLDQGTFPIELFNSFEISSSSLEMYQDDISDLISKGQHRYK